VLRDGKGRKAIRQLGDTFDAIAGRSNIEKNSKFFTRYEQKLAQSPVKQVPLNKARGADLSDPHQAATYYKALEQESNRHKERVRNPPSDYSFYMYCLFINTKNMSTAKLEMNGEAFVLFLEDIKDTQFQTDLRQLRKDLDKATKDTERKRLKFQFANNYLNRVVECNIQPSQTLRQSRRAINARFLVALPTGLDEYRVPKPCTGKIQRGPGKAIIKSDKGGKNFNIYVPDPSQFDGTITNDSVQFTTRFVKGEGVRAVQVRPVRDTNNAPKNDKKLPYQLLPESLSKLLVSEGYQVELFGDPEQSRADLTIDERTLQAVYDTDGGGSLDKLNLDAAVQVVIARKMLHLQDVHKFSRVYWGRGKQPARDEEHFMPLERWEEQNEICEQLQKGKLKAYCCPTPANFSKLLSGIQHAYTANKASRFSHIQIIYHNSPYANPSTFQLTSEHTLFTNHKAFPNITDYVFHTQPLNVLTHDGDKYTTPDMPNNNVMTRVVLTDTPLQSIADRTVYIDTHKYSDDGLIFISEREKVSQRVAKVRYIKDGETDRLLTQLSECGHVEKQQTQKVGKMVTDTVTFTSHETAKQVCSEINKLDTGKATAMTEHTNHYATDTMTLILNKNNVTATILQDIRQALQLEEVWCVRKGRYRVRSSAHTTAASILAAINTEVHPTHPDTILIVEAQGKYIPCDFISGKYQQQLYEQGLNVVYGGYWGYPQGYTNEEIIAHATKHMHEGSGGGLAPRVYMVGGVKGVQFTFQQTQSNHFDKFLASSKIAWNGFQIKPCATPTTALVNTHTQSPTKQQQPQPNPTHIVSEFKKLLLKERAAKDLKIKVSEVATPVQEEEEGEVEVVNQQRENEQEQEGNKPNPAPRNPKNKRARQPASKTSTSTALAVTNSHGQGASKRVVTTRTADTRMEVLNVSDDEESKSDKEWSVARGRRGGARGGSGQARGGGLAPQRGVVARPNKPDYPMFTNFNRYSLPG
jgi:hypothetical protein